MILSPILLEAEAEAGAETAKTILYAAPAVWNAVFQFGIIAVFVLVANLLRRRIPFIRRSLMPVSVIAGFMMLIVKLVLDRGFGIKDFFNIELLDTLVYHCIALGFIAMSLRVVEKKTKGAALDGARSGAMIVGTYLVQAFTGLVITVLIALLIKPDLFKAAGLLLPMGYGQGPGQANNIGSTYEAYGFTGGKSFGLAIAAAGYIVACTVGVVVLNIWKKKKLVKSSVDSGEKADELPISYFQDKNELPISDSIDKLSIQVGIVMLVYLITYLITKGVTAALDNWAPGLAGMLNPILWGFNFIIGAAIAMLFRKLFAVGEKHGFVKHRYQNGFLLNRISGFFFDIMIVAGIACIDPEDLSGLWLPFVLLAVAGGVVTWFFLRRVSRFVYKDYYYEGLISMYGMMTGTIGSGILLLREIDPEFKTPAANNLVLGSSYGILFGAPLLVLITSAAKSDSMLYIVMGIIVIYFLLLMLFISLVGRKKKGNNGKKR